MAEYAHPEALVTTGWVAEHAADPKVRLVEVDVDPSLYPQGHIAGAVGWNWQTDLCDQVRRDIIDKSSFEKLCSEAGIRNDSTVVLAGDSTTCFGDWTSGRFKFY